MSGGQYKCMWATSKVKVYTIDDSKSLVYLNQKTILRDQQLLVHGRHGIKIAKSGFSNSNEIIGIHRLVQNYFRAKLLTMFCHKQG